MLYKKHKCIAYFTTICIKSKNKIYLLNRSIKNINVLHILLLFV